MSVFRPSVAEERWLKVSDLAGEQKVSAADTGGWRNASLLARCAFFFLGVLAAVATFGLVEQLTDSAKAAGFVTAILCIAVAELLITRQRFFGMGIEEALYLSGLIAILPIFLSGRQEKGILSGLAIACGLAAIRLANPLFASLAVAAAAWRLSLSADASWASAVCWIGAIGAWLVIRKYFARPSTQRLVEWMSIVLPLLGYAWITRFGFKPWAYGDHPLPPLLLLAGVAIALVLGLRWRQHALLLAFAVCIVLFAIEVRALSPLSLEAKLILYGAIVLISSVVIERRLRRPHGITSLPLGPDSEAWKLIEVGTAATLATSSPHHGRESTESELETGGGSYGGGGSSGSF